MSSERKDSLECKILKQLRQSMLGEGRWMKGGLFHGRATGEVRYFEAATQDWRWQPTQWEDFEINTNSSALYLGLSIRDPETPAEALASLITGEYVDDDSVPSVKDVAFQRDDYKACLVGGIYISAGELGVDDNLSTELIQVMVATGRAVQSWCQERIGLDPLSDEQREQILPYNAGGLDYAESVIIAFNDDQATDEADIDEVIKRADIELACIRQEVPA